MTRVRYPPTSPLVLAIVVRPVFAYAYVIGSDPEIDAGRRSAIGDRVTTANPPRIRWG